MILSETLRKAHQLFPTKRAIVCGNRQWTYLEFNDRVHKLVHGL